MARPKHYSPQISRFLVSVLYFEAKARKIPMTKLTEELLKQALMNKHADIGDACAHDLVIRATDVGVCSNRLIPSVLSEWREPRHPVFESRNVWSLFNAFTESLKDGALSELPKRSQALHGLLDSYVGLN